MQIRCQVYEAVFYSSGKVLSIYCLWGCYGFRASLDSMDWREVPRSCWKSYPHSWVNQRLVHSLNWVIPPMRHNTPCYRACIYEFYYPLHTLEIREAESITYFIKCYIQPLTCTDLHWIESNSLL